MHTATRSLSGALAHKGLRLTHFFHRELVSRAKQYPAKHNEELIEEAKAIVERWRAEVRFGSELKLSRQLILEDRSSKGGGEVDRNREEL
jgi:hypothetical protein